MVEREDHRVRRGGRDRAVRPDLVQRRMRQARDDHVHRRVRRDLGRAEGLELGGERAGGPSRRVHEGEIAGAQEGVHVRGEGGCGGPRRPEGRHDDRDDEHRRPDRADLCSCRYAHWRAVYARGLVPGRPPTRGGRGPLRRRRYASFVSSRD